MVKRKWQGPEIKEVALNFTADVLQVTCPTTGDITPHGETCTTPPECSPQAS